MLFIAALCLLRGKESCSFGLLEQLWGLTTIDSSFNLGLNACSNMLKC